MLDFTSALYLGMRHAARALRPWQALTTGRPAALADPPGAGAVAQRLAELVGCEQGILAPSTLHLFWDLFGMLDARRWAVYVDNGAYPIARWGVERAAGRGVPVRLFPHHNGDALRQMLRDTRGRTPLVVTDGFCPSCGQLAPLVAYQQAVQEHSGWMVLDDTQALGVLGAGPRAGAPYGRGGGGTLRCSGVRGPRVLLVASLAKGFGAPVALLAGGAAAIKRFEARSDTRVHCSPPSAAVVAAAARALSTNAVVGEALRVRLWRLVQRLPANLAAAGLGAEGGVFPVQTLALAPTLDVRALHHRLLTMGVRTVLRREHGGEGARISLLITTQHTPQQIDRATEAIAQAASYACLEPERGDRHER